GAPAARRRHAAVPAQPGVPRSAARPGRHRRYSGLRQLAIRVCLRNGRLVWRIRPCKGCRRRAMQAFQLVEWQRPAELREVPVPGRGRGQVLIKVGGAGACHSDLHIMEAPAPPKPSKLPFTLGHENAGWVEKLGPGATGFAPGDSVIVYGPWGCGNCKNCRMGQENYCEN